MSQQQQDALLQISIKIEDMELRQHTLYWAKTANNRLWGDRANRDYNWAATVIYPENRRERIHPVSEIKRVNRLSIKRRKGP